MGSRDSNQKLALGDRRPLAPPARYGYGYDADWGKYVEHAERPDGEWCLWSEVQALLEAGETRAAALQRQVEQLTEKVTHQRGELANVNVVLRRKNVELDALHFVWCSGPCGEPVTQAIVTEAIRNTDRLIEKFNGQRSNRAWKALHEYPDDQKALVSAWGDLRKETARAEAAEAAIVSLQADYRDLEAELRDKLQLAADDRNHAVQRQAALECDAESLKETILLADRSQAATERLWKEDHQRAVWQMEALQAQLQAITQEMREESERIAGGERPPCDSFELFGWADRLAALGKEQP